MRLMTILAASLFIAIPVLMAGATAQEARKEVERAATQPLRDTRLKQDKIPAILLLAASAPYSSVNTRSCATIAREVDQLTQALGPDVDTPATEKGESAAIAAAAARGVVNTFIPGLGIVRVITGADKAQRRAEAAVYAGSVRRGYLKGLGLAKGCRPSAAPRPAAVADIPEMPKADGRDE